MARWLSVSLSAAATAAVLAACLLVYQYREQLLPPDVPTHYNVSNQVDQTTPRDRVLPMLLILPGVMVGMLALALVLPWLSPKPFSLDSFRGVYNYAMLLIVLLFGWIEASLLIGMVWSSGIDVVLRMLLGGVFLFIALLGALLGKVRRNFWIGVRTPWTLANEEVWNQTHRLAAWTVTIGGLVACTVVLIHPLAGLVVGFPILLAAALTPAIYSLVLYKRLEKQGRV